MEDKTKDLPIIGSIQGNIGLLLAKIQNSNNSQEQKTLLMQLINILVRSEDWSIELTLGRRHLITQHTFWKLQKNLTI